MGRLFCFHPDWKVVQSHKSVGVPWTPPDRREAARALRTLAARAWHRPIKAHDRNMTRKQLASHSIYEHQRKRRDRAG